MVGASLDIYERLVSDLANCVERQVDDSRARLKINRKIMEHDILTEDDVKMIDELVDLVKKMQDANQFDLIGRSDRMRQLEEDYAELRDKLMARMGRKQPATCSQS